MRKNFKKFTALLLVSLLLPWNAATGLAIELPEDLNSAYTKELDEKIRAIVQVKNDADINVVKSRALQYKDTELRKEFDVVFKGFSLEIPESYLPLLRAIPGVEKVTKSELYFPTMASSKLLTQSISAAKKFANNGEGMVVSIIDSGIDVKHKDLQKITNPEKAKIKEPLKKGGKNKDTEFTLKVPYGYNFADDSYYVKGDTSNHGIHVGGIVGANATDEEVESKKGIDGVASEVQLLAMKVFSNDPNKRGASDDDIIAAIESSIEHGADIINMSLGSPAGFTDDRHPVQRAVNAATEKGVLVVIAAGNETAAFAEKTNEKKTQNLFADRDDIGMVGSPSTARGALSVASFENSHKFVNVFEMINGDKKEEFQYRITQGAIEPTELEYVFVGEGKEEDYKDKDVSGKVALIKRGSITFTEKSQRAKEKGAKAVLVFNNEDGDLGMSIEGIEKTFFIASTTKASGEKLVEALKSGTPKVKLLKELKQTGNELNGDYSPFTSWGTTSALDFKPEVSGVGGKVYSLDNDNGYVMESGTSMASPHVAGASAIVYSQLKKDVEGIKNYAKHTKKTLINTAKIVEDPNFEEKIPFSPRRQGSGLIQTEDAIKNKVLATFETEDGDAVGALRSFTGVKTFKINLKNYGKETVTFNVEPGFVQTTATVENFVKEVKSPATIKASETTVTLAPNQSKEVEMTLDATKVENDFVEGFVRFVSTDQEKNPSIHFAYMGYAGDWNKESAFDKLDTKENNGDVAYGHTRLLTFLKNPYNPFAGAKIVPIGLPFSPDMNKEKPSVENFAFSPNNDGFGDVVLPQMGTLRNMEKIEFRVLDSSKKVVRVVGIAESARKMALATFKDRVKKNLQFTTIPWIEGLWDGKLYNAEKGQMEFAKDGQYYLQAAGKLSEEYAEQELLFPVKVDTKAPTIEVVLSEDKEYALTDKGREVTVSVKDDGGLFSVYGKVGKDIYTSEKLEDGKYKIVVPYTTEIKETLTVFAGDFAYNESKKDVVLGGNALSLTNWEPIIDKKINEKLGQSVSGTTKNEATKFISFKFVNKKTNEVIESKETAVVNGKIPFASFTLTEKQQARYSAFAVEKGANKEVLKETSLGTFVYDYTLPTAQINFAEEITDPSKQKNPLKKKDLKGYVEYAVKLNPDGTATYEGKVSDNVFEPMELTLTIGTRMNVVKINPDGTFKYVLKTPSEHFDFINLSQPSKEGNGGMSSLFDGLDLAGTNKKKKKKLERTYVVSKYIPSTEKPEVKEEPFKLTLNPTFVLGLSDVVKDGDKRSFNKIVERDGKYFFKITGFANRPELKVFVAGEEATARKSRDNGTLFEREVEVVQGSNAYNVRIEDKDGKLISDTKVRIIFDKEIPNLVLTSPGPSMIKSVEGEEKLIIETNKDEVTFAGTISDNGLGYELNINGDVVATSQHNVVPGSALHGNNEKSFEKVIPVKDGDIIVVGIADKNKNAKEFTYVVKKLNTADASTQTEPAPDKKDGGTQTEGPETSDGSTQTEPAPDKKDGGTQTEGPETSDGSTQTDEELMTLIDAVTKITLTAQKSELDGKRLHVTRVKEGLEQLKDKELTRFVIEARNAEKSLVEFEKFGTIRIPVEKENLENIFMLKDGKLEKLEYTLEEYEKDQLGSVSMLKSLNSVVNSEGTEKVETGEKSKITVAVLRVKSLGEIVLAHTKKELEPSKDKEEEVPIADNSSSDSSKDGKDKKDPEGTGKNKKDPEGTGKNTGSEGNSGTGKDTGSEGNSGTGKVTGNPKTISEKPSEKAMPSAGVNADTVVYLIIIGLSCTVIVFNYKTRKKLK